MTSLDVVQIQSFLIIVMAVVAAGLSITIHLFVPALLKVPTEPRFVIFESQGDVVHIFLEAQE